MAAVEQSIEIRAPISQVHKRWTEWCAGAGDSGSPGETLDQVGMLHLEALDESTTRVRLRLDEGAQGSGERIGRFLERFKEQAEKR